MRKKRIGHLFPFLWIPAVLFLVCMMPGSPLSLYASDSMPAVKNGVLDLTEYDMEKGAPIKLAGTWNFYWRRFLDPGTDPPEREPDGHIYTAKSWNSFSVEGKEIGSYGYGTYRVQIKLGRKYPQMALKIPPQGSAYRLYINGKKIFQAGRPAVSKEDMIAAYNPSVVTFVPDKEDLHVVLHISNYQHIFGGMWRAIELGIPEKIVKGRERALFVDIIVFGVLIIMSFYHLALFLLRRSEKSTLYFSALTFTLALRTAVMEEMILLFLFPHGTFEAVTSLEYLTFCLGITFTHLFVRAVFPGDYSKLLLKVFVVLSVLPAVIVVITSASTYTHLVYYLQCISLASILYVLYVLACAVIKKRTGAVVFISGLVFFMCTVVNDILFTNGVLSTGFLAPAGLIIFIFSQAFLISFRFSRAFRDVENLSVELDSVNVELRDLNENLEHKVKERTQQLQEAKENVEQMNDDLSEKNRSLEEAQKIMDRDMEMAVNVQGKFLPGGPPLTEEWDIACEFRPMAGVSGDFYDFYLEEGQLLGLTLCDVSGHGISSGLVTMIAKSVIFRSFMYNREKDLGTILDIANRELIEEIGPMDNYVTGILLRFYGNNVEYVNAGHPDMLVRKIGGRAHPAGKEMSHLLHGHFLGVPIMDKHYRSFSFEAEKGDFVCIFSDCLEETQNASGEVFGMEGIRQILDTLIDDITAAEALRSIILTLEEHGGSEKLKDDLTVIVMKRLV